MKRSKDQELRRQMLEDAMRIKALIMGGNHESRR